MAIIDPEGLFQGERLAACSDMAQFCWPRLYLGSNGYARLELSYSSIISKIFRNFKNPPKSAELWEIFREYEKNFLAILYEINGVWWCEFATSEKWLPRYKTRRDEESPAPTLEDRQRFHSGLLKWKSNNSFSNESFQKVSEDFVRRGVGVGVGVGDVEGINTSCTEPKQVRSVLRKEAASIPLNTGEQFPIYQDQVDDWSKAYPAVNVLQEILKAAAWSAANPTKRKTKRGVLAFLNSWLSRAQDRNPSTGAFNGKPTFSGQREQSTKDAAERVLASL